MAFAGAAVLVSSAIQYYQGEKQQRTQKRAMREQESQQRENANKAAASQRQSEQEQRQANQRQPDLAGMAGAEQSTMLQGPASTMLTARRRSGLGGGQGSSLGGVG